MEQLFYTKFITKFQKTRSVSWQHEPERNISSMCVGQLLEENALINKMN